MADINLSQYGITGTTEVVYNPSYELLFEEETKAGLEGYEVGKVTELGAVNVMTGIYTGRSPKAEEAWASVKAIPCPASLSMLGVWILDSGLKAEMSP